jgi:hypothetical protein
MAHWLLRGQMAEHREDERNEQRRAEQNKGYDEAARGGRGVPPSNVGTTPGQPRRREDAFDREAREAANDVRRRDSSAE